MTRQHPAVPTVDGLVVTAAGIEAFDCPFCQASRDLVVPDCADDHDQCPDRACAECGYALVVGSSPVSGARVRPRPGTAPYGHTRRAG